MLINRVGLADSGPCKGNPFYFVAEELSLNLGNLRTGSLLRICTGGSAVLVVGCVKDERRSKLGATKSKKKLINV